MFAVSIFAVNIAVRRSMPRSHVSSTARKRPAKGYHHGDLRGALISTALAMVTEEGAWNFTLREVARRAGVSHTAPYNHFEDKSALLAEVAALGFESLRQTLEVAARGQPRSGRLAFGDIAAAYVRFGVEHPAHYRLMFGAELAEKTRYPTLEAANAAACSVLTRPLERGHASGRDLALAAWSLLHGLTTLLIDQRVSFLGVSTAEAERHARVAAMALFEGLRTKTT
jgi:AcrR family transcriptional regulator